MYKLDLALDNQELFIWHKTKPIWGFILFSFVYASLYPIQINSLT